MDNFYRVIVLAPPLLQAQRVVIVQRDQVVDQHLARRLIVHNQLVDRFAFYLVLQLIERLETVRNWLRTNFG